MSTTATTAPAKAALPNEGRPGYKHTKLGWIPEEWEQCEIGDLKPFVTSGSRGWAAYYSSQGAPFIRITNMTRESIHLDLSDLRFVNLPSTTNEGTRTQLNTGDVLISVTADVGIITYVDDVLEKPAYINQHIALVRIDPSKYSSKFISYFLACNTSQRHLRNTTDSGAKAGMSLGTVRKIKLALPSLSEQRRIAEVLGAWDRAIATAQQLLAAQQERKRGLMQELLTGKRRFPGFGEKWKSHRLGDLFERVTRKNTVGEEHVLTISAQHGLIDQREIFNKSVAGANLGGYYLLKNGEFAYNKSSSNGFPFGAIKRLDRYAQGVLSTLYICFRLKPNAGNSDFLAAYFDSGMLDQGISMVAQEGARNHGLLNISSADFFDIDMRIPPADEQSAIAKAIGTLNAETAALTNYLDHLTTQKRGLMQQLLTGAVRVKC